MTAPPVESDAAGMDGIRCAIAIVAGRWRNGVTPRWKPTADASMSR